MKDISIREEWANFVHTHDVLFQDGTTAWRRMLRKVQDFLLERGDQRRPSRRSKEPYEKRLSAWINHQQCNYANNANIMKDATIREE
eukprot:6113745-Pleurochrysis_carterae.AAC.1